MDFTLCRLLRHLSLLILACWCLLAPVLCRSSQSSSATDFREISLQPSPLAAGSPALLTVHLEAPASSVSGDWNHEKVLFFRARSGASGELWFALLGADVEMPAGSYPLTLEAKGRDGTTLRERRSFTVSPAHYRTTEIHVAPSFVEPGTEAQKEIAADKVIKQRVFARSADTPEWSGDFAKPTNSPATDSFGTRRTFNGKLASIHRGMDFRAASGTPVAAANSGTVVIAQKLFYEGNCVVIDHGLGLWTIYMHFSRIDVTAGEHVSKGQRLGLSGATGRVTGPHLHFAVRWQDSSLDPAGLFRLNLGDKP